MFAIFGRFKEQLEEDARAAEDAASRAFADAFCEDGYVSIANWSMADYIRTTKITQEDLTARLHAFLDELDSLPVIGEISGVASARRLDFSKIYTADALHGDGASSVPDHLRVHTEDALVCSHGYENPVLPEGYAVPPTADSGLLSSVVIFVVSAAALLWHGRKKTF